MYTTKPNDRYQSKGDLELISIFKTASIEIAIKYTSNLQF